MKDSTVNCLLGLVFAISIAVILGLIFRAMTLRDEMNDQFKRACMPGILLDSQKNPVTSEQKESDGIFLNKRSYMLLCTDGKEKWVRTVEGEIKW